jgi:hypothetical protein
VRAIRDFEQLLDETHCITHKSWQTINDESEEGRSSHMHEIVSILQMDSRCVGSLLVCHHF